MTGTATSPATAEPLQGQQGTGIESRLRRVASERLDCLLRRYSEDLQPIEVSFRQLVGPIPVSDLTHSIYPYPARILRQIPRFFLNCEQAVRQCGAVLDPFCGSGTVIVESCAAGIPSWGIDSNPFARLLTQVKTTNLESECTESATKEVLERAKHRRSVVMPEVVNVDHWFGSKTKRDLGRIYGTIGEMDCSESLRRYLLLSLALTAERCSLRDQRIPVPVRRHDWMRVVEDQPPTLAWDTFSEVAQSMGRRVACLPVHPGVVHVVEGESAVAADQIYDQRLSKRLRRPGLVLTSPPYGAAQKYIRSSSLALGWTGLAGVGELAELERQTIGREHFLKHEREGFAASNQELYAALRTVRERDEVRAMIYAEYFRAMAAALRSVATVMAPGGMLVLIAGTNVVAGQSLETGRYLKDIIVDLGLVTILELHDELRGRVLLTKRRGRGTPMMRETIFLFRKG